MTTTDTADRPAFTYAYLISPTHSGSTLLSFLLAAHPEISSVGEMSARFPPHIRCSCGKPFPECPYWSEWKARSEARGIPFNLGDFRTLLEPGHAGGLSERVFYYEFPSRWVNTCRDLLAPLFAPKLRRYAREAARRNVELARVLCEQDGTSVFFDTTKNPYQIRFLAPQPDIRLKVIVLIRDARGQINSNMRRENRTLERAIGEYRWGIRNFERVTRHYLRPEDVVRVRYEDLCADVPGKLAEVCRFLGLERSASFNYSDTSRTHIIGNVMRLRFDGKIALDEKWRNELTPAQIDEINAQVGDLNRRYGYV